MGDALAGRWSPDERANELPITQLHVAVAECGRRRGVVRLRQALELVRSSVWSPKETELRLAIVRAGLPEPPGLNSPIVDAEGSVLGHGDLVWPAERLVVEYEGDQHRADRWQWRSDIAKYERYADAGWRVVRVTAADIEAPAALIERIARLLAARALT